MSPLGRGDAFTRGELGCVKQPRWDQLRFRSSTFSRTASEVSLRPLCLELDRSMSMRVPFHGHEPQFVDCVPDVNTAPIPYKKLGWPGASGHGRFLGSKDTTSAVTGWSSDEVGSSVGTQRKKPHQHSIRMTTAREFTCLPTGDSMSGFIATNK